ncbi:hypothetical protein DDD_2197 [Nonlabens dokdonensis DSW-6]|uniref:Uncharacterized protein n=1 Tax=Nonlabens dokdonensis (strain DSM 17205 / KCTC 12402 / DSW-6) TaxID=592029 RepID=L7WEP2_NONDD|nr:hypothetical protein DDD_2197 [Nonlabens dokdonensis DSW-6]
MHCYFLNNVKISNDFLILRIPLSRKQNYNRIFTTNKR